MIRYTAITPTVPSLLEQEVSSLLWIGDRNEPMAKMTNIQLLNLYLPITKIQRARPHVTENKKDVFVRLNFSLIANFEKKDDCIQD